MINIILNRERERERERETETETDSHGKLHVQVFTVGNRVERNKIRVNYKISIWY